MIRHTIDWVFCEEDESGEWVRAKEAEAQIAQLKADLEIAVGALEEIAENCPVCSEWGDDGTSMCNICKAQQALAKLRKDG